MIKEALYDLRDRLEKEETAALEDWCETMERFWTAEQSVSEEQETKSNHEPALLEDCLVETSDVLRSLLLCSLRKEVELKSIVENMEVSSHDYSFCPPFCTVMRMSKNLLRWYLQIYSALCTANSALNRNPIPEWKTLDMLNLYVDLIEQLKDPVLSQHASQLLFYASYNPLPGGDGDLQSSFGSLIEEGDLLVRILKVLVRPQSDVSLTLSLVRNVHNIAASFPQGCKCAAEAKVECIVSEGAPWLRKDGTVTFKTALPLIALSALDQKPKFPGDKGDKRPELVVEITRACYILRFGRSLSEEIDSPLAEMVLALLRLDLDHPGSAECHRSSATILMDASGEIGDFLVAQNVTKPLLGILEMQVNEVLKNQLVNDTGAAMLTPILAFLHKCCHSNEEIRQATKLFVFPRENEEDFIVLLRQEIEVHGTVRSMTPLQKLPPNSMGGKLIQLLTWPQSHIKRFAGELIWELCERNQMKYVARVGMGNAVMILAAKGLVRVPGQSSY